MPLTCRLLALPLRVRSVADLQAALPLRVRSVADLLEFLGSKLTCCNGSQEVTRKKKMSKWPLTHLSDLQRQGVNDTAHLPLSSTADLQGHGVTYAFSLAGARWKNTLHLQVKIHGFHMHLRLSGAADLQVHSVIYPLHLRVKITIFCIHFTSIDTQNIFVKILQRWT